jgi:hypothetical protein
VHANKKLSNFTFQELTQIKNDLFSRFYKNPRRIVTITYKCLKLRDLSLIAKIIKMFVFNVKVFLSDLGDLDYQNKMGINKRKIREESI